MTAPIGRSPQTPIQIDFDRNPDVSEATSEEPGFGASERACSRSVAPLQDAMIAARAAPLPGAPVLMPEDPNNNQILFARPEPRPSHPPATRLQDPNNNQDINQLLFNRPEPR